MIYFFLILSQKLYYVYILFISIRLNLIPEEDSLSVKTRR